MSQPLLAIRDLRTYFSSDEGVARAVDGLDLEARHGEAIGLVGESGCGKSVTALSILRLLSSPPAYHPSGQILLDGVDLLALPEPRMRQVRGKDIAMVFQEPMTSLNPVFTVGDQVAEAVRAHFKTSRKQAWSRAVEMLERVGIPAAVTRAHDYPHSLSGGMRQRVMIAMALACGPRLLIADEPTTALDVTIQAQILDLLRRLSAELGMSILLITHDLGVVAEMAARVAVMYAGRAVEEAPVEEIFSRPRHPYTVGLLHSIPSGEGRSAGRARLAAIPGVVPDLRRLPPGCKFAERCSRRLERCLADDPTLEMVAGDSPAHRTRCFNPYV